MTGEDAGGRENGEVFAEIRGFVEGGEYNCEAGTITDAGYFGELCASEGEQGEEEQQVSHAALFAQFSVDVAEPDQPRLERGSKSTHADTHLQLPQCSYAPTGGDLLDPLLHLVDRRGFWRVLPCESSVSHWYLALESLAQGGEGVGQSSCRGLTACLSRGEADCGREVGSERAARINFSVTKRWAMKSRPRARTSGQTLSVGWASVVVTVQADVDGAYVSGLVGGEGRIEDGHVDEGVGRRVEGGAVRHCVSERVKMLMLKMR